MFMLLNFYLNQLICQSFVLNHLNNSTTQRISGLYMTIPTIVPKYLTIVTFTLIIARLSQKAVVLWTLESQINTWPSEPYRLAVKSEKEHLDVPKGLGIRHSQNGMFRKRSSSFHFFQLFYLEICKVCYIFFSFYISISALPITPGLQDKLYSSASFWVLEG